MNDNNPYEAPKAVVADVIRGEPPGRPRVVGIAFALLWASLAIGLLLGAWRLAGLAGQGIAFVAALLTFLIINVPLIGLFFWIFRAAGKGRNWGRITVLVLAVVASILIALSFESLGVISAIDIVARFALWIAATVLLFLPASSTWYRAMKGWREAN